MEAGKSKNKECRVSTLETGQAAWFLLSSRHSGMYSNILGAMGSHRVSKSVELAQKRR